MKTTEFYNTKSTELIDRYDKADMSLLHNLFIKYIPLNSSVIDIGFGSGRDLQFLYDNGYDVWGIDPSSEFIKNAKNRFSDKKDHFFKTSVPFQKELLELNEKFEAVISIAVWMHFKQSKYEEVVANIVQLTKPDSSIIISYSDGKRLNDERYFEDVNLVYLIELFNSRGFTLVETIKHEDSLNRKNISWKTVIFKND
ncbi:methyltransferase [Sulfurimonas gotlandica GD1]|uniref:Methyltransferase n=1 Tax=Sulfurimonas gotlandica (strain DSM 19862 / JCM 16533 / GD1) TaxID=929558 RepID=B6BL55_SULGG|nr:class I SAM-dependent methyltransferase [Sulfurimonas gotlandica]EDZ62126.1 methyltransferase type 12, putative [Sulfurimonas gotlandica GD1]EHP28792.1 methyltransferase [Sulfurimonas gotlandica GD1]